jgi:hypothetical protein
LAQRNITKARLCRHHLAKAAFGPSPKGQHEDMRPMA